MPKELRDAIAKHNAAQNANAMREMRNLKCTSDGCMPKGVDADRFEDCNLLLPMAFQKARRCIRLTVPVMRRWRAAA